MTDDDIKRARERISHSLDRNRYSIAISLALEIINSLLAERERLMEEVKSTEGAFYFYAELVRDRTKERDDARTERDALLAEAESLREGLAGLESVRREQAAGRDYWARERDSLRDELRDTEVELARARNERERTQFKSWFADAWRRTWEESK